MLVQLGNPFDTDGALLCECPIIGKKGMTTYVLCQLGKEWVAAEISHLFNQEAFCRAPDFPEAEGYSTRAVVDPLEMVSPEALELYKGKFKVCAVKKEAWRRTH